MIGTPQQRNRTTLTVFCKRAPSLRDGSNGPNDAPRRISDTSKVSLKSQLKMVKVLKEISSRGPQVKTRTSHRRKRITAEEREVYKAQQIQAEQEARKTGKVTFKSLYG